MMASVSSDGRESCERLLRASRATARPPGASGKPRPPPSPAGRALPRPAGRRLSTSRGRPRATRDRAPLDARASTGVSGRRQRFDVDDLRHSQTPRFGRGSSSGCSSIARAGSRTLTAFRSMTISPNSSACRARASPSRTSSSRARSVTTHSARMRSGPATEEKSSDQVLRSRSRISLMRSSTESGLGSTCRGTRRFWSSMSRCIARCSRCTERSSSGMSSGGGSSAVVRP